jgi:hypothetical protein
MFLSFTSTAQFNRGSLLLGSDLSFNTNKSNSGSFETKSSGISFSPTIAVATKQNTFWGGSLSARFNKTSSDPGGNEQKVDFYGAGFFCRKYKQVFGKFYAFIQTGVNAEAGKSTARTSSDFYSESNQFNIGATITPGISIAVSGKVYLETGISNIAAVNYSSTTTKNHSMGNVTESKSSGFNFSSSLGSFTNNFYFGFRFILPKKS